MIYEVALCLFHLICHKIPGCNKENEEEILLLGGVCKLERSQGITSFFFYLSLVLFSIYLFSYFSYGSHCEK